MALKSILAMGDNRFLVPTAFLEGKIALANFRVLFGADGVESALNKQRIDVGSGPADTGGFFSQYSRCSAAYVRPRSRDASRWEIRTYPRQFPE